MIQFTTTSSLREALTAAGIEPSDYKPAYASESVGLDLYNAGPEMIIPSLVAFGNEVISPDSVAFKKIIPSGLKIALPPGHAALVLQRGSIRKTSLIHRAGVVDPGYTDEIFISVLNFSTEPYVIKQFEKLPFQIIVVPVLSQFCFIEPDVYDTTTRHAIRKTACLGSSDVPSSNRPVENAGGSIKSIDVFDLNGLLNPSTGYL